MSTIKKISARILLFVVPIVIVLDYYFVIPVINNISGMLLRWTTVVTALGVLLGFILLVRKFTTSVINKRVGEWQYSLICLVTMAMWLIVGFGLGVGHELWSWLYDYTITPLNTAFYGVMAFYFAGLVFRALRVRTFEVFLFALSAGFLLMTRVPIGHIIWPGFPLIGRWILSVPNSAAQRGIIISGALGAVMIMFRLIMGKESSLVGES